MSRLSVDADRCEGYGFCEEAAPGLLRLNDDAVAEVLSPVVPAGQLPNAESAVQACPVAALLLERGDGDEG